MSFTDTVLSTQIPPLRAGRRPEPSSEDIPDFRPLPAAPNMKDLINSYAKGNNIFSQYVVDHPNEGDSFPIEYIVGGVLAAAIVFKLIK